MTPTEAIANLRAMCRPRELTAEQRAALVALRGELWILMDAAGRADEKLDGPLRGLLPQLDVAGVLRGLDRIELLLAEDRRARGLAS